MLKQTIPKITKPKTFNQGVCDMRNFRLILPVFLAALFVFTSQAFAAFPSSFDVISGTRVDTVRIDSSVVNGDTTDVDVPCLAMAIVDSNDTFDDTLRKIIVHSDNDTAYSVTKLKLWIENHELAGFQSSGSDQDSLIADISITEAFQKDDSLIIDAINLPIADNTVDTFYFSYDINPDIDSTYNNKYCALKVNPFNIEMDSAGVGPAAGDTLEVFTTFGAKLIRIDVEPPQFTLMAFDLVEDTESNGIIDLGDSVRVFIKVSPDVNDTMVKSYFAAFDTTEWVTLDDSTSAPPPSDSFVYRHRIPLATVGLPLDVDSNFYYLIFTAEDIVGNQGRDSFLVSYPIDTKKPVFPTVDSVTVELVYDLHGSGEGVISIGDSLKFTGWMTNNPFGEIETVWVNLDSLNSGVIVGLADISNRIWTWTYEVVPGNLDTLADSIACWFVAEDNAGNLDSARSPIPYPIDIVAPSILVSDIIYAGWVDIDANNVMNLGDSVIIRVDASGVPDLDTTCGVMVNLLHAGLGGPYNYCMEDSAGTGIYRLLWELKPDPQDSAIDVLANVADVDIALKDDAGNDTTITSNPIDKPVDTTIPAAVKDLLATPKKDCVIELSWGEQAYDAYMFAVFWDSGYGGEIFWDDTLGTSFDTSSHKWSTIGDNGITYRFAVQTLDDANNSESPTDTLIVSARADCEPPVVCITSPESGLTFGPLNPLFLIGESNAPDVEDVKVLYRFKDTDGMGTPGPWYYYDNMYSSGGLIYKDTIPDLPPAPGDTLKGEGTYELIAYAHDSLGNILDTLAAYDSCHFEFNWFFHPVPIFMVSVNDTVSPQSGCGYNVSGDSNKIVVDVTGATPADSFTLDVYVIIVPPDSTARVYYVENITMPHTFYLDVTYWEPGTQKMFVKSINEAHNIGVDTVDLCVPEWQVPVAEITSPKDGQRVHRALTSMNPVLIRAELSPNSPFGVSEIDKVEFEYSLNATDWILIETKLDTSSSYWQAEWDNSDTTIFTDGLKVYLRAKFYIPDGSFGVTSMVYVFIDASVPVIDLKVQPIVTINGVDKISGPVDLFAYVKQSTIDIKYVSFFWKYSTDPDIFFKYNFIDKVTPVNPGDPDSATIFAYRGFNSGSDQDSIDIRAISEDQAGNVLFDYDGDMLFDDGWFSLANPSDTTVFRDEQAPDPAIDTVKSIASDGSDTITFVNPSAKLGGNATVFLQAGRWVSITSHILPAGDSVDVDKIEYYLNPNGYYLGTRYNPPYKVTFNPADLGIYPLDGYESHKLTATLYDKLGNSTTQDTIRLYFLDVTGNQVVITSPANNSYKKGSFTLQGAALDGYSSDIKSVTYQYGVVGSDTTWYDICTAPGVGSCTWHTYNNDLNQDGDFTNDDGWYPLRAVSEDNAGNPAIGPVIRVNVTNHDPSVQMNAPDNGSFVGPNYDVVVEAFAQKYSSGSAGIDSVLFGYKKATAGGFTSWIGTDYLTLYDDSLYSIVWNTDTISEGTCGLYHLAAFAYDSAGNVGSDTFDIIIDAVKPYGKIVAVNGNHNPEGMDIYKPDTCTLTARAYDVGFECQSGVDSLQFMVERADGKKVFFSTVFEPDPTTEYSVYWDHRGEVGPDTFYFFVRVVDKMGNVDTSYSVMLIKEDHTIPMTVIRAFPGKYIYASLVNPANNLQFQYRSAASEWINVGAPAESLGIFEDHSLWRTKWDPASMVLGSYWVRAVPLRGVIAKPGLPKFVVMDTYVAHECSIVVEAGGVIKTAETEDIGPMSFEANALGPVKGTATFDFTNTTKEPYLLAVYSDLNDSVTKEEVVILRKETGSDTHHGLFDAGDTISFMGGTARFYTSTYYGNACWIEDAGFSITKVTRDFGTNGWVWSMDGTAKIDIPTGAVPADDDSANLLIYPAQAPYNPIIIQKDLLPVGNENGLLQHFYLYSDEGGSGEGGPVSGGDIDIPGGIYSTIVLSYNQDEVQIAESTLQVGRWTGTTFGWSFSDIRDLVIDTVNNTVEFKTNQMGLYAVVQNVSGISIMAMVEVEPNCSDYTYKYPLFKATIKDNYSGVYANSILMRVGPLGGYMMEIYSNGSPAAGFSTTLGYDPVSGILKVEPTSQPFDSGTYVVTVSARNNYGIKATAVDTFIVETAPPELYIPKHYVSKNPEFWFTVKDAESGVDKNSIFIDFAGATYDYSDVFERKIYFTMTPSQIDIVNDTVYIDPLFELKDDDYLHVVIYNGIYRRELQENESYVRVYADSNGHSHGIYDCVGNQATVIHQWFPVDGSPPVITLLSELSDRPLEFRITDARSGIKTVVADPAGTSSWDSLTGKFLYTPSDGDRMITITATDTVGNVTVYPFTTEAEVLAITDVYNYPNPFDPTGDGYTTIELGLTKGANVTVKIYDFAGDYVTTLSPVNGEYRWKGTTEDGEMVANGVYLCYIKAKDGSNTVTEVIKIAVVKKD